MGYADQDAGFPLGALCPRAGAVGFASCVPSSADWAGRRASGEARVPRPVGGPFSRVRPGGGEMGPCFWAALFAVALVEIEFRKTESAGNGPAKSRKG